LRTVRDGLPGGSMPYFRDLLKEDELRAVVAQVKSFSGAFAGAAPAPLPLPAHAPADAASLARGKALYTEGCAICHGADHRGGREYKDGKGYPVIARDLTAPWTFRGGAAPAAVWLRLTVGVASGPMPSFAPAAREQGRRDLRHFIRCL